jgi:arylformamidase
MSSNESQSLLDIEYSPSSCVDNFDALIQQYAELSQEVRERYPEEGHKYLDLSYGVRPGNKLDLFVPNKPSLDLPLNIYIHGGYWQELDKSDSSFLASNFNQAGAAVASINYTLAPQANLNDIVAEVTQSIIWLYKNARSYGIDPEQIFLSGSSAGAHLAAMMLYQDWFAMGFPENPVKGICAVSGIYDLALLSKTYVNDKLSLTHDQVQKNSPLLNKPKTKCPVILAYGENETSEFKRLSKEYRNFLIQRAFDVSFFEVKSKNHFDVILDLADKKSQLFSEVSKQMKLKNVKGE